MFIVRQEVTADQVLLDQGKAELPRKLDTFLKQAEDAGVIAQGETISWQRTLRPVVEQLCDQGELTPEQNDLVVRVMRLASWRGREADGRRWYRGDFALADLDGVLIGNYWAAKKWSPLPAPQTIGEFARHADPKAPVKTIEGAFDLDKMRGCPIYMAETMDALVKGPWTLREGANRSRAIVLAFASGALGDRTTFPVIIGVPRA
jgi:hypothetical protein